MVRFVGEGRARERARESERERAREREMRCRVPGSGFRVPSSGLRPDVPAFPGAGFRPGLVLKAHRRLVSLNTGLESEKEEEQGSGFRV